MTNYFDNNYQLSLKIVGGQTDIIFADLKLRYFSRLISMGKELPNHLFSEHGKNSCEMEEMNCY